jgi:predicted acylesterase/phospholipase RssA
VIGGRNKETGRQKDVTVVLGGGGAKGFVHLGVLLELSSSGIHIASIVGTSIGTIIAALFAHYSSGGNQLDAAERVAELLVRQNFWERCLTFVNVVTSIMVVDLQTAG